MIDQLSAKRIARRMHRLSGETIRVISTAGVVGILAIATPGTANAHPHVFIEANLEVVRNDKGEATEIRHVWRFDEFFSSSLLLDFDANGNGKLDESELQEIAGITRQSIAEYNFYTEVRNGETVGNFYEPEPYIVDQDGSHLLIIMSLELEKPMAMGAEGFKIAVSDPTYYVAVDLQDEGSVLVSGNDKGCRYEIVRPDFDKLYAEDAQRLADLFAAGPDDEVEASDDYLTWVEFKCS